MHLKLDNPAISSHEQVKQICRPIFNLFNITFFRYLRVFQDGSRIHLCTDPSWTSHFYGQCYYKIAWCDTKNLGNLKNMEILWDERALRDDNIVGVEARAHFKIYHGISIIRHGSGYYEIFDFATTKKNIKINDVYFANLDLFERFFFYFRHEARELIDGGDKQRIRPTDLMASWVVKREGNVGDKSALKNFLRQTETKRYYINTPIGEIYLTQKEVECIYWSVLGKSAEETSIIIGSSKRTVEIHLNNIRQKLHCVKIAQAVKVVVDSGVLDTYKFSLGYRRCEGDAQNTFTSR